MSDVDQLMHERDDLCLKLQASKKSGDADASLAIEDEIEEIEGRLFKARCVETGEEP